MDFIVHVKVDKATKLFYGITRFDCGGKLIISKKLWFMLERMGRKLLDPKRHTFIHSDDHI